MTIVLGLRCPANGIVLCADSQESVKEYYKESTRKLQFDSIGGGWAFGYGAAGDGHYCDFVEQQICESLKKLNSFGRDEVKSCIKEKLHLLHERHMWPNPDYYSLRVDSLMALQNAHENFLLKTAADAVIECPDYAAVGIGQLVATHWLRAILPAGCGGLSVDRMSIIAAYVLWYIKRTVDGCGGETVILEFTKKSSGWGAWGSSALIHALESEFQSVLQSYGKIVLSISSPQEKSHKDAFSQFQQSFSGAIDLIEKWRSSLDSMQSAFEKSESGP